MRYAEEIEEQCKGNGYVVLCKKLLPEDDLADVIRNSKVFVFPSEVEAMSMMLLEVVSCRKLVVCSDIKENVEVLGSDYKYLFSLDDTDDLASKMEAAINDRAPERTMEPVCRRCIENFSWRSIAQEYEKIYDTLREGAN